MHASIECKLKPVTHDVHIKLLLNEWSVAAAQFKINSEARSRGIVCEQLSCKTPLMCFSLLNIISDSGPADVGMHVNKEEDVATMRREQFLPFPDSVTEKKYKGLAMAAQTILCRPIPAVKLLNNSQVLHNHIRNADFTMPLT